VSLSRFTPSPATLSLDCSSRKCSRCASGYHSQRRSYTITETAVDSKCCGTTTSSLSIANMRLQFFMTRIDSVACSERRHITCRLAVGYWCTVVSTDLRRRTLLMNFNMWLTLSQSRMRLQSASTTALIAIHSKIDDCVCLLPLLDCGTLSHTQ